MTGRERILAVVRHEKARSKWVAERQQAIDDIQIVRDYFKDRWDIDSIIEHGREKKAKP